MKIDKYQPNETFSFNFDHLHTEVASVALSSISSMNQCAEKQEAIKSKGCLSFLIDSISNFFKKIWGCLFCICFRNEDQKTEDIREKVIDDKNIEYYLGESKIAEFILLTAYEDNTRSMELKILKELDVEKQKALMQKICQKAEQDPKLMIWITNYLVKFVDEKKFFTSNPIQDHSLFRKK